MNKWYPIFEEPGQPKLHRPHRHCANDYLESKFCMMTQMDNWFQDEIDFVVRNTKRLTYGVRFKGWLTQPYSGSKLTARKAAINTTRSLERRWLKGCSHY
jgi:hypothetical protein